MACKISTLGWGETYGDLPCLQMGSAGTGCWLRCPDSGQKVGVLEMAEKRRHSASGGYGAHGLLESWTRRSCPTTTAVAADAVDWPMGGGGPFRTIQGSRRTQIWQAWARPEIYGSRAVVWLWDG